MTAANGADNPAAACLKVMVEFGLRPISRRFRWAETGNGPHV